MDGVYLMDIDAPPILLLRSDRYRKGVCNWNSGVSSQPIRY
jgi:hypothetical protein